MIEGQLSSHQQAFDIAGVFLQNPCDTLLRLIRVSVRKIQPGELDAGLQAGGLLFLLGNKRVIHVSSLIRTLLQFIEPP